MKRTRISPNLSLATQFTPFTPFTPFYYRMDLSQRNNTLYLTAAEVSGLLAAIHEHRVLAVQAMHKDGCSARSIARTLALPRPTVQRWIIQAEAS